MKEMCRINLNNLRLHKTKFHRKIEALQKHQGGGGWGKVFFFSNGYVRNVFLQANGILSHFRLTYNTNGLPDEAKSTAKAHILRSTAGRPQTNKVLDSKKENQANLHPKQLLIGESSIFLYR